MYKNLKSVGFFEKKASFLYTFKNISVNLWSVKHKNIFINT